MISVFRDKKFVRALLSICIPITLQSLISFGVNMLDNIMLGSLGEIAMSGVALANQIFFFFTILNFGLGGGIGVLASQFWGKRDVPALNKCLALAHRLSMSIAVVMMILGLAIPGKLMMIFTNEPGVIEQGIIYLRYMSFMFIIFGLSTTTFITLRSVGTVKISLAIQAGSFLINLVLNYMFIFGRWGAPRMEVAGAALATLIARIFEFSALWVYMAFFEKKIHYKLKYLLRWDQDIFRRYLKGGVAVLASDSLLGVGMSVLAMIMGHIGSEMVAANSIVSVISQLAMMFNGGIASAGSVLTGNSIGEGKPEQAYKQGVAMLILAVVMGVLAGLLVYVLRYLVVDFYQVSQKTKDIAYSMLDIAAILLFFQTISSLLTKGVLRGGGDTRFLLMADTLFLWAVAIPLGAVAGLIWHLAPAWVFLFLRCDEIMKSIWCTFRLFHKKWIKDYTV